MPGMGFSASITMLPTRPDHSQRALRTHVLLAACVLAALMGIVPYIVYAIVYPELSLETLIIYRRDGDFAYLPQIRALADLRIGESILPEHLGDGVRSFPIAALILHALSFRLFGPIGLIIADSAVYVIYFGCLIGFFRELRVHAHSAAILSLAILLLCPCQSYVRQWLPAPLIPIIFGLRFPRPFVSEIFLLGSLTLSLALFAHPRPFQHRRLWGLLSIVLALLVQTDIYPAITFLLHVSSLTCRQILFRKYGGQKCWPILPYMLLPGLVCSLPFFIQRVGEHPDLPRRFGVFPVSRLAVYPLSGETLRLLMIMGIGVIVFSMLRFSRSLTARNRRQIVHSLWLGVWAFLAQPMSCLILGATIQPYHFALQFEIVTSYMLLIFCILGGRALAGWLAGRRLSLTPRQWLISQMLVLGLSGAAYIATFSSISRQHVRPDFAAYATLPDYRDNFSRLAHELTTPEYAGHDVLATLDIQVYVWWTTFRTGHAFLTDPFNSAVSDDLLEDRLIRFGRLAGIDSSDRFAEFIQQRHINLWWLGHNKYQASKAHTYAPLSEYPAPIRQAIQAEPWGVWSGCWRVYIPESEIERLKRKFEARAGSDLRPPDIIILTGNDLATGLRPPVSGYIERYGNDAFRVYVRCTSPSISP